MPRAVCKDDRILVTPLHGDHVLHIHLIDLEYIRRLVGRADKSAAAVRDCNVLSPNKKTAELFENKRSFIVVSSGDREGEGNSGQNRCSH